MKICPDCLAANRSHETYCQECSGALVSDSSNLYPQIKLTKKMTRRRVPLRLLRLLARIDHRTSSAVGSDHHT